MFEQAQLWMALQKDGILNGVNEMGLWWDDEKGSTHFVSWPDVQGDLMDAEFERNAYNLAA